MSDRDPSARFARALMTAAVRPKRENAMDRKLYAIEWTHDDGMDQHNEFGLLTEAEADKVRAALAQNGRGAIETHVYEIIGGTLAEIIETIDNDLPIDEEN